MLQQTYGDRTIKQFQVYDWHKRSMMDARPLTMIRVVVAHQRQQM